MSETHNPMADESGVAMTAPAPEEVSRNSSMTGRESTGGRGSSLTMRVTLTENLEEESVNLEAALLNKASPFSCYICLANTIMGAGILGLPYALAQTGWLLGTIIMIFCACNSVFALHELAVCAALTSKPSSFYSVAMKAAPDFVWLIDAAVAIKCFGVATSYLIIIGGVMPEAMQQMDAPYPWQSRHLWIAFSLAIVAPVAFQNSLEVLKFTSTMSVVFVSFVAVVIICFVFPSTGLDACADVDDTCVGDRYIANPDTLSVFGALPIFVFGFTCQQVYIYIRLFIILYNIIHINIY